MNITTGPYKDPKYITMGNMEVHTVFQDMGEYYIVMHREYKSIDGVSCMSLETGSYRVLQPEYYVLRINAYKIKELKLESY